MSQLGPPMQIQACRGRTTGRGIILEHITSHTPVTPEGVGGFYIILYYMVLCCIGLYYTILYYIILYYIILYYIISYVIILYCIILYYILYYIRRPLQGSQACEMFVICCSMTPPPVVLPLQA